MIDPKMRRWRSLMAGQHCIMAPMLASNAHGQRLVEVTGDIFTDQAPPSQTWQVLLFIIARNLKYQNVFKMTR